MSDSLGTLETPIAAAFSNSPNRDSFHATIPISKKSISSMTSSSQSRRSSTTPLADRFMNGLPSSQRVETPTPGDSHDRLLPLFLSYDPSAEIQHQQKSKKKRQRPCCCSYHHRTNIRSTRCSSPHKKRSREEKTKIGTFDEMTKKSTTVSIIDIKEEKKPPKQSKKNTDWMAWCCFIRRRKEKDLVLPGAKNHSNRACFCYCGRREWVMMTFVLVVVGCILGFVLWPRTPLIRIEGATRTGPTKVTQTGSERMMSNVAFESVWILNITMDNRRNYLPTRFNRIQIYAKDAVTGLLIGKGTDSNFGQETIPGRTISTIQLPISINYQARDKFEPTFSNLLKACTETQHHSLPIHFWFTLYIYGLDWLGYKPSLIATPANGGFICPL